LIRILVSEYDDFQDWASRLWCQGTTWRHRWRHYSTRHRHFPIESLLKTNPKSLSFRDI